MAACIKPAELALKELVHEGAVDGDRVVTVSQLCRCSWLMDLSDVKKVGQLYSASFISSCSPKAASSRNGRFNRKNG